MIEIDYFKVQEEDKAKFRIYRSRYHRKGIGIIIGNNCLIIYYGHWLTEQYLMQKARRRAKIRRFFRIEG